MFSRLTPLRGPRWHARRADAIVVSIPKSGRTWLRVAIQAYRANADPERLTLVTRKGRHPPVVFFTHERWAHRTTHSLRHWLFREYLLPDALLREKPVVLLARDPRDVMVSLYFEMTRRSGRRLALAMALEGGRALSWPNRAFVRVARRGPFRGTMAEFLRHPLTGTRVIVEIMNGWLARFASLPRFRLVRYEDLRAAPLEAFRDLLGFFGLPEVDDGRLVRALAFASFENMRRLEASGQFDDDTLRPGDPADPESFKVRRGKVGGYVDYLSAEEVAWLDAEVARLDPAFGYARPAGGTPRPLGEAGGVARRDAPA